MRTDAPSQYFRGHLGACWNVTNVFTARSTQSGAALAIAWLFLTEEANAIVSLWADEKFCWYSKAVCDAFTASTSP